MSLGQAERAQPERDAVERHFAEVVAALDGHPPDGRAVRAAPGGPGPGRLGPDRPALPGPVRGAAGQPPSRSGRALATCPRRRVLHDRVIRPRGQRGRRRGAAGHRPGSAALPVRGVLPGPVPAGHAAPRRGPGCPAGTGGGGGRAHRRRPPQGLRPSAAACHPADLDHRLAPAPRSRPGLLPRPVGPARPARRVAPGCDRDRQPRRRVPEPLHRGRGDQRRRLLRLPASSAAAPDGDRGQRDRDQRADPARLGPGRHPVRAGLRLLPRGRVGPGRRL